MAASWGKDPMLWLEHVFAVVPLGPHAVGRDPAAERGAAASAAGCCRARAAASGSARIERFQSDATRHLKHREILSKISVARFDALFAFVRLLRIRQDRSPIGGICCALSFARNECVRCRNWMTYGNMQFRQTEPLVPTGTLIGLSWSSCSPLAVRWPGLASGSGQSCVACKSPFYETARRA